MMHAPRHSAFTLVELLVVLGIMALMAGGLGLALQDGSPAVALESAQGTVASLVTAARGQAALSQRRTRLVVNADPADERFLRGILVAVESAPNSGQWRVAADGALLPRGIYVVPGSAGLAGTVFNAGAGTAGGWPDGRRSSLVMVPPESILPAPGNGTGIYLGMTSLLTGQGTTDSSGGGKLVLAAARLTSGGVNFEHPERVRGIVLSSYGVAILINDGPGFDF